MSSTSTRCRASAKARSPIVQENIRLVADDLMRLQFKRPFSDGTFALDLDPLSLLVRLATTVPPPAPPAESDELSEGCARRNGYGAGAARPANYRFTAPPARA